MSDDNSNAVKASARLNGLTPVHPIEENEGWRAVDGLTKREHIAAVCLQGLCSNDDAMRGAAALAKSYYGDATQAPRINAAIAVDLADALLVELARRPFGEE